MTSDTDSPKTSALRRHLRRFESSGRLTVQMHLMEAPVRAAGLPALLFHRGHIRRPGGTGRKRKDSARRRHCEGRRKSGQTVWASSSRTDGSEFASNSNLLESFSSHTADELDDNHLLAATAE